MTVVRVKEMTDDVRVKGQAGFVRTKGIGCQPLSG